MWDGATGTELMILSGHTDGVTYVALSPDGTRNVSGSLDKSVRVWDASIGTELMTLQGHTGFIHFTTDTISIISHSVDNSVCAGWLYRCRARDREWPHP